MSDESVPVHVESTRPRASMMLTVEVASGLRFDELIDDFEVIDREQVDTRRWYSRHRVIFRTVGDGRFWEWRYDEPLTEIQEWPDLYERDLVATEVFPTSKTITVYQ